MKKPMSEQETDVKKEPKKIRHALIKRTPASDAAASDDSASADSKKKFKLKLPPVGVKPDAVPPAGAAETAVSEKPTERYSEKYSEASRPAGGGYRSEGAEGGAPYRGERPAYGNRDSSFRSGDRPFNRSSDNRPDRPPRSGGPASYSPRTDRPPGTGRAFTPYGSGGQGGQGYQGNNQGGQNFQRPPMRRGGPGGGPARFSVQSAPKPVVEDFSAQKPPSAAGADALRRSFRPGGGRKRPFPAGRKERLEKNLQAQPKLKNNAQANPVPKSISIMESISVAELAKKMNLKASTLLSKLMSMGTMVSINANIDAETAQLLAAEYDCEVKTISLYEQTILETDIDTADDLQPRPPIVTVMGHVDHGKTTLLDAIRKTEVAAGEQGNITQHIGAYQVHVGDKPITFLDTPGHAAFSLMRARGAQITDIVVLVVAANDSVNTQTKEAVAHAREAKVPIIVALNKIDAQGANPDKIFKELSEIELVPEEWGGTTPLCKISALKNEGIDALLETILLQADLLDIKANPARRAEGKIIEARIEQGHGIVATVIVERGTLRSRDSFIAGIYPGKVRMLIDDKGRTIKEATPSMPVEVIGLEGVPSAGDPFQVTEGERESKQFAIRRQELARHQSGQSVQKVTKDTLYSTLKAGAASLYKVIIKGDVHGSVEAIKMAIEQIGNEEAKVQVISAQAGEINESDIMLASASDAHIIGFNVKPSQKIQQLAQQNKVTIHRFSIIFDVIEKMKEIVTGMLSPDIVLEKAGEVEVREIFVISKVGIIAGSYVRSGRVTKNAAVHIMRGGKKIAEDVITSLKRFQDNVNKVEAGFECGITLQNAQDLQKEDVLIVFEEKKVSKSLE